MTAEKLYAYLDAALPAVLPTEGDGETDTDGAQCMPDPEREIRRVLVALDPYEAAVELAVSGGYDLLLSHHPLIYGAPVDGEPPAVWYSRLYNASIASFSFHVRLDVAAGGVNDILADRLGLSDCSAFGIPELPTLGRIGNLSRPMTAGELARFTREALNAPAVRYTDAGRPIRRVAVIGGAASSFVYAAVLEGADALVCGELKQHIYGYADGWGIAVIEAGHYHTEQPVTFRLRELVLEADPTIEVTVLERESCRVVTR